MRLRMIDSGGTENGDGQLRRISWFISWHVIQSDPRSKTYWGSETSPYFRKSNRQIAELTSPVTLRKQTTTNCSNRQKIQFRKRQISTQKLSASSKNSSLAEESRPQVSNRERLELEIPQLIENKRPRPVLIANFEPIHFPVFPPGRSR
jgi:hypothetical protein